MQSTISKVHAHMPYHLLPKYMKSVLQQKLNLEIYFHHWILQDLDKSKCLETAKLLAGNGLKVTFHAPFLDLRPAALDDKIRQTSLDRIKQVFDLAPYFHPLKIVCHPSFDDRYYVSADDLWLENSVKTWTELIVRANPNTVHLKLDFFHLKCHILISISQIRRAYRWHGQLLDFQRGVVLPTTLAWG